MKTYGGVAGIAPTFVTAPRGGGERSDSRLGRFTLGERIPGTSLIEGRMVPKASSDAAEKRKNLAPTENRTPSLSPLSGIIYALYHNEGFLNPSKSLICHPTIGRV
jgi:hypothetical protein